MYGETIKNKISELEANLNDKSSGLEQKVQDIAEGVLVVADVVDELPIIIKEEVSSLDNKVSKELKSLDDKIAKVKTIKGAKGDKGDKGNDGLNGTNGKDGSPDTPTQIVDKINSTENAVDWKVLKNFDSLVDQNTLKSAVETLENQTRYLIQSNRSTTTTGGGTVESIVAGTNVSVDSTDPANPIVSASFSQTGKYMISGGATWSGTGLVYDISTLTYFFNGNKTASPTSITLDASDPTNNRIDAIVVDESGTITVITGTPSGSPESPAIPDDQLQVTFILVEAATTEPTIASEEIYMDDPTTDWTFSTYSTATPTTGSINFAGTTSPKQGTECIEASTDLRLGARFVRATSFDAYQYTMFQVWVRFTGTAVATNKSLNVRFENSAGTLVGNTINLFSYGLQRTVLNDWQLVVVPITAFGALPATVKGLKVIMAGGTVGVARQWDLDYMILTNGSVPFANVPTIAFYKDDVGIASQSGINLIEGTGVTIDAVNNPTNNRVDYTINASGGSTLTDTYVGYGDSLNQITGDSNFTRNVSGGSTKIYNTFDDMLGTTYTGGLWTQTGSTAVFQKNNVTFDYVLSNVNANALTYNASVANQITGASLGLDINNNEIKITSSDMGIVYGVGVNKSTTTVNLGSLSGGNGTKIDVNDTTQLITITNVPAFDSEADAITAGLTTGQIYQSTVSDPYLNIAGILKIVT